MRSLLAWTGRRRQIAALCAVAFAFAYPMQVNGFNQTAHYALVHSLAAGTPNIDKSRGQVGDLSTGDAAIYKGHYYATRPPGLAAASLPAFWLLKALGMRTTGDPTTGIWALHLWSVALPACGLLLLVAWGARNLVPDSATAIAIALGVATLVLPFATLFFSHVPSAFLVFAAFALLWRDQFRPRLWSVIGAGVLAGLAVTTEYPTALAAAILGVYAISRGGALRRAAAYGAGLVAGVLPLLAFNVWAFGSPTHIAHEDFFSSAEHQSGGVFLGFSLPSPYIAADLLFSTMGLLFLTPILALGTVAAAVYAFRSRYRNELLACLAIGVVYLAYNSTLRSVSPFGGLGPPRYLITIIPFLMLPVALAWRRFPVTAFALTFVSGVQMALLTATGPLAAYDGRWVDRVEAQQFMSTGASVVGVTGWYSILPFFAALGVAALQFAGDVTARSSFRDLATAAGSILAWSIVALAADNPNGSPPTARYVAALAGSAAVFATLLLAARRMSQTVSASPVVNSRAEQSGQVNA
jgi:hypothetical protein